MVANSPVSQHLAGFQAKPGEIVAQNKNSRDFITTANDFNPI